MNDLTAQMVGFLADAMSGGTDYAAERMEREAQALVVVTKRFPKRMDPGERQIWEALGFKFGPNLDDLFMQATMPPGWDQCPDPGHSMYVHIIDDRGRRRGQYFYKGSFYDREAIMWGAERRFTCEQDYSDRSRDRIVMLVKDCRRVIHRMPAHRVVAKGNEKSWETSERVENEARTEAWAWLKARFPEADNPLAYWSLPDEIDFDLFPSKHEFMVYGSAGDVIVTFPPSGARGEIRFDEGGQVKSCNLSALGGGCGSQDEIWRKVKAWAALIANQPNDPRPRKAQ